MYQDDTAGTSPTAGAATTTTTTSGWGWRAFNLVYLTMYFSGWLWQAPERADVIAIALALVVFLPVYLHAYEGSTPRFIPHLVAMELLAWALAGFAGVHGVFHVYACVQAAFQRPRRRAIWLIATLTAAYAAFALIAGEHWLTLLFTLGFGVIVGGGCIAAADGLEREQLLRRSRVLERQQATLAERERIAHELHDLLGQTLTMVAVKSDLAAKLVARDPARARSEITDVARAARDALTQIRTAVYDMTATSVESEIALARQALEAAGVRLEVRSEMPPLSPSLGKALGLTIREATTNIVRHSQADAARISIGLEEDGRLQLVVADNGVGAPADGHEGTGLSGLRKRVADLGGETVIEQRDGMQIRVRLPLERGNGAAGGGRAA